MQPISCNISLEQTLIGLDAMTHVIISELKTPCTRLDDYIKPQHLKNDRIYDSSI